jgi:hypothetical protein
MEKRFYPSQPLIICNCGNHLLVAPGCTCDVCMGVAAEPADTQQAVAGERRDRFDMSYFEALERMFESFDFAA